jgi:aspartate carbamoyltransferase, regulatory subunit
MKTEDKTLKVTAIKDGTVLDHIPAGNLFQVVELLDLKHCSNQVTIGFNLESRTYGRKGIIKVADRFFKDEEINRIALVAPKATINIIRDFQVVEKKSIAIPDEVVGIAVCSNPSCVTNHQPIATHFHTIKDKKGTHLLCHYCEKVTELENLKIIGK